MVLCQGAGRQLEEICCFLLLSSGSDAQQGAWEGSGAGSWTLPCFVIPMLMECKACLWSQCTQPALVSIMAWGERQRGVKPMMPALEFGRAGGQISCSWRQSEHTWAGLHHSPTSGPQEVAQAWAAPAVLTLFNNDLSYSAAMTLAKAPYE